MARKRYGYNETYRGRQGGSAVLKWLILFLAALLVVAVAFAVFMGRYIQYTDDGPQLTLPWLQEKPEESQEPDISSSLIIDGEDEGETADGSAAPASEGPQGSAAPEPIAVLTAVEVTPASLIDGSAQTQAAQAGANALVVAVKDREGNLAWNSMLVLSLDTMNGDIAFNQAAQALSQSGELHLTAKLSGFQDLWTSVYDRETAVTTAGGKLWYDQEGYSWISASNEKARTYLTNLCLELAAMGFDEILLEHAGFPDSGRTGNIQTNDNYPASGRDQICAGFLGELSQALAEKGVELSVEMPDAAPESGELSGLTPAALANLSGRVWLPQGADPAVWTAALTQAGMEDSASRVVAAGPLDESAAWTGSRLLAG